MSKLVCVQCGTYAQSIANCQAYIAVILSCSQLVDENQHKAFSDISSNSRLMFEVGGSPQVNLPFIRAF